MPIVEVNDYKPSWLFRNAHYSTIYPAFFRKLPTISFERIRVETPDEDFLDLDTKLQDSKKAFFLFHGLEGSTSSQYMMATSQHLFDAGYDIYAVNFRGCSGVMNRKLQMYHSGFTSDPKFVIDKFADQYEEVNLVGYSMGGNIILKYLGEDPQQVHNKVSKVFAISTPTHLSDGVKVLRRFSNRIYEINFMHTLRKKVIEKAKHHPNDIDVKLLDKVKNIWDFDEYFTGPIHGFEGAEDYYAKSMSKQFLHNIKVETHIINALNDPFLSMSSVPFAEAKQSKYLHLHPAAYGGHVGFYSPGEMYWVEKKILEISKMAHSTSFTN